MSDKRIVFGAGCMWWDSIDEVATRPDGAHLPCCPHCGGVLFEVENEEIWFRNVDTHERRHNPGYRAMIEWARGKCFKTFDAMEMAYKNQEGQCESSE